MNMGAYMWAFQRITGLLLVFYLLLHLYTLGSIGWGEDTFNRAMALMDNTVIKSLEIGLLWTTIFHALNGIRLILINLFVEINQRTLAYGLWVVTIFFVAFSISFIW
jgi:succinate dehydrogenase / fumarate reductase cytochrome b subunit